MKTKRNIVSICIHSFIMVVLLLLVYTPAKADIEPVVKGVTASSIKISWKKQKKVSKYVVYRRTGKNIDALYNKAKYKKIKTLKGTATGFTDKKVTNKRYYQYRIDVYSTKGKKSYSEETGSLVTIPSDVYLGWRRSFSENGYHYCYTPYDRKEYRDGLMFADAASKDFIMLWFKDAANGIQPVGYEIYRQDLTTKSDYKKIDIVAYNKKVEEYKYTDKSVQAGHEYQYRIRSYYVSKGKKVYGDYSKAFHWGACNQNPIYTVKEISPLDESPGTIVLQITSDRYNHTLALEKGDMKEIYDDEDYYDYNCYGFDLVDNNGNTFDGGAVIDQYSKDGNSWVDCKEKLLISGGETVMIRFKWQKSPYNESVPTGALHFKELTDYGSALFCYPEYEEADCDFTLYTKDNKLIVAYNYWGY